MENVSQVYLDNFTVDTTEVTEEDQTSFETSPESHGGPESYGVPFHHRAIAASILSAVTMLGLFGNTLIIIAVVVAKKLRTITNILVVNLAFADLVTCSCIPFQVAGLLSRAGRYPLPELICATVAGVMSTCICFSGWTLAIIAIVRWYVITKSVRGHQGFYTPKKIATLTMITWTGSVVFMVLPPVLGLGTLGYSEYYGICFSTDTNPLDYYYVTLQGTLIAIILIITLVFYILILCHVLRHNKQFRDKYGVTNKDTSSDAEQNNLSSESPDFRPPMIKAINRKEINITKNLFIVVLVFMLCFLASSANLIIPGGNVFTLYSTMLLMMNSVANPIIYGLKHPNFQEVFKRILRCHLPTLEHVST